MGYAALLIGIGLAGGFVAGLLGLGGSILLVPLLLGIPPALGYAPLDMRAVAAISLVQVAFATGAALLLHRGGGRVEAAIDWWMGGAGAAAALAGGLLSAGVASASLLGLFAVTATVATVGLFFPRREPARAGGYGGLRRGPAALVAGVTGLMTGLVGAAGGFLLAPFLQHLLRVSPPSAQSAALRIVLVSAAAGLAGKLLTGQVPLGLAAALVLGALPGAWWGGEVSRMLDPRRLRWGALGAASIATLWVWGQAAPVLAAQFHPGYLYLIALAVGIITPVWVYARTYLGARVAGPYLRPMGTLMGEDGSMTQPGIIRCEELQRLLAEGKAPQMIDVREADELAAARIPGVIHIPLGEFAQRLQTFKPEEDAVIVCRSGNRSGQACFIAARAGFRTRNLVGGMLDWKGPVERG
ncbi:MAG: TSUP family transporter [Bacillota bacterium]